MKLFKFNQFINESNQEIDSICKKYGIENYTINEDRTIDVDGGVNLSNKGLTELPLKFRRVSGYFYCSRNKLTSLEGAPISVGGIFDCYNNQLTSLEGAPKSVAGNFDCYNNKLTTLEGSPKKIGGFFRCDYNKLKDVYGIKEGFRLGGYFNISKNPVYEIFKLFPKDRYDDVIEFLNEYEVIRDGKYVVLQALEEVFYEMDLDCPQIEYIKGYEII
jgi:hypothetical protein